jgi:hypothetical protein
MVNSLLCNRLFFPLLSARGIRGKELSAGRFSTRLATATRLTVSPGRSPQVWR